MFVKPVAQNKTDRAPYSRPNPVLTIIRRFRDKGLPLPITTSSLERIGISYNTASQAMQAIRFLDLVNADGKPTEAFEKIKRVSEEEYRAILAGILRTVYKPVFELVDPAKDSAKAIDDAFRHYEPYPQRERMVELFMALAREAQIAPPEEATEKTQPARRPPTIKQQSSKRDDKGDTGAKGNRGRSYDPAQSNYAVLNVMLQQLPANGRWTKKEREKWLTAFEGTLDFSIDVIPEGIEVVEEVE